MYRSLLLALLSAPFLALAQTSSNPNPFNVPTNFSASAGSPLALSWNPTTSGTISLILRSGASSNLVAGTVIASSIANSGSYTWTPSTQITRGSDYTVEIVDDATPSLVNYSPYFVIDSPNTVAYSTSEVSLGAATSSIMESTASPTGSATSVPAAISSASSSASMASSSGGSSSSSGASSSRMSSSSSMAGSSSSMSMAASSATSAMSSAAADASSSATAARNGGARATAAAGMLGLAALGALAL